jgi:putative phosphoribosyl transferase
VILFENRRDAAEKLLTILPVSQMRKEKWEVLATSESGVIIADTVAKAIGGKLDYLFTEPIQSPVNKDVWIAVVSETEEIVINRQLADAFNITIDYIYGEAKRKHAEKILGYLYKYRKGAPLRNMRSKNVILVDEGADTGLTLMVSLKTIFAMNPARIVVALPVIPESLMTELFSLVDNAYLLHRMRHYIEAKSYYRQQESVDTAAILAEKLKTDEKQKGE